MVVEGGASRGDLDDGFVVVLAAGLAIDFAASFAADFAGAGFDTIFGAGGFTTGFAAAGFVADVGFVVAVFGDGFAATGFAAAGFAATFATGFGAGFAAGFAAGLAEAGFAGAVLGGVGTDAGGLGAEDEGLDVEGLAGTVAGLEEGDFMEVLVTDFDDVGVLGLERVDLGVPEFVRGVLGFADVGVFGVVGVVGVLGVLGVDGVFGVSGAVGNASVAADLGCGRVDEAGDLMVDLVMVDKEGLMSGLVVDGPAALAAGFLVVDITEIILVCGSWV